MSPSMTRYLIDTSVFIQAFRQYYSFAVCPGFWQFLVSLHKRGVICSIDKVFDEICFGDEDELTVWAKKTIPKDFFADSTAIEVVGGMPESSNGRTPKRNSVRLQKLNLQPKRTHG
jgi:Domain of unknown function (DUF4411)